MFPLPSRCLPCGCSSSTSCHSYQWFRKRITPFLQEKCSKYQETDPRLCCIPASPRLSLHCFTRKCPSSSFVQRISSCLSSVGSHFFSCPKRDSFQPAVNRPGGGFLTWSWVRSTRFLFCLLFCSGWWRHVFCFPSAPSLRHFLDKRYLSSSFPLLWLWSAMYPPACVCRGCHLYRGRAAKPGRGAFPESHAEGTGLL